MNKIAEEIAVRFKRKSINYKYSYSLPIKDINQNYHKYLIS